MERLSLMERLGQGIREHSLYACQGQDYLSQLSSVSGDKVL